MEFVEGLRFQVCLKIVRGLSLFYLYKSSCAVAESAWSTVPQMDRVAGGKVAEEHHPLWLCIGGFPEVLSDVADTERVSSSVAAYTLEALQEALPEAAIARRLRKEAYSMQLTSEK